MVELRKRKAPAEAAPAPPTKKALGKAAASKPKEAGGEAPAVNGASSASAVSVGSTIALEDFGGEIETNDGEKTSLKKLVDESEGGVVLFTYPKASTPGSIPNFPVDRNRRGSQRIGTTQACLFRDEFAPLTATGFSIYGLSRDSPKSNTSFKTKQKLPYALLCDPAATLISAIEMKKAPSGTTRGVFVVDKEGKVLAAEAGGPAATVDVVRKLVGASGSTGATETATGAVEESKEVNDVEGGKPATEVTEPAAEANGTAEEKKEDEARAEVAADVADSAKIIDDIPPV